MTARLAAPQVRHRLARRISMAAMTLAAIAGLGYFGARLTSIEGSIIYDDGLWEPLSGHQAGMVARRVDAAFGDAQLFWAGRFELELGQSYQPTALTYFSLLTPSPCAGSRYAAGSFHCGQTNAASMDLAFLDVMGRRMVYEGEAGEALLVGRIVATHVQDELGRVGRDARKSASARDAREPASGRGAADLASALEADCLTGVWAHHAADWVAALDAEFYARLIEAAREVSERRPGGAVSPDEALLGPGAATVRAAAFETGRAGGTIGACVPGDV
jgi:uncharacterized protein